MHMPRSVVRIKVNAKHEMAKMNSFLVIETHQDSHKKYVTKGKWSICEKTYEFIYHTDHPVALSELPLGQLIAEFPDGFGCFTSRPKKKK